MLPDDERHGSEAGYSAHHRAGQSPCLACHRAKLRGDKRRRVQGPSLVRLPPEIAEGMARLSVRTIHRSTGVSACAIENMLRRGDKARVTPATLKKLRSLRAPTDVGTIRRVQALSRLGWSSVEIGAAGGIPATTVARLRDHDERRWIGRDSLRLDILTAYAELSMKVPTLTRWSSRIANRAVVAGWPPPLAWDDIDNPDESPTDWQYRPASRTDNLAELVEAGVGITEACKRLDIERVTLEKWCERNGMRDLFNRLTAREPGLTVHHNQHTKSAA